MSPLDTLPVSARWTDWSCSVVVTLANPRHLDRAVTIVRGAMEEVELAASRFRTDSHLERINRNPGRLVPVSPLTLHLVTVALDAARATEGAVDPTVGAALIELGYDQDIDQVRRSAVVEADSAPARPRPSWRSVVLDRRWRRVGVPAGVSLDLGATAKAWAADEAARRIHRHLGIPALVGIGGDLAVAGAPARDWRVDVAERVGGPAERVGLHAGGIATSSSLARRWTTTSGETRHHVIDPRTGIPAHTVWRTTTVWAPTALGANVMSTWALVDPLSAVPQLLTRGLAGRFVHDNGRVATFGNWPAEPKDRAA